MIAGKFKVNISYTIPSKEKVSAYVNESLAFHLYQKGHMMKQIYKSRDES